jgi:hypothetical protein
MPPTGIGLNGLNLLQDASRFDQHGSRQFLYPSFAPWQFLSGCTSRQDARENAPNTGKALLGD